MIDLSISIVNTNNWQYLEPCLQSIMENSHNLRYEILVVDNASDDGSAEKIKAKFPDVILTENAHKYGFAKNNNINLRKSQGRYLMLLNDDTLVQPGALDIAIRFLDENPDVGVVGCKILNPDGTIQYSSARKFRTLLNTLWGETGLSRLFGKHPIFASQMIGDWDHNTVREIDLPLEAGMIVRREVMNSVGILDEQFFMFGEGADWCRRIKRADWKIVFLPDSSIIHFGGTTNRRANLKMFIQHYKSTYLYFRKENIFTGYIYRVLIILIYLGKYMFLNFKTKITRIDSDLMPYYQNLLVFMLRKINDPNYPFPT